MITVRPVHPWTLIFIVVALARSERAHAAEQVIVALDYQMSPSLRGCPEASQLEKIVASRLGYPPFRSDGARHVIVRIAARDLGIEGSIEWRGPLGRVPGQRRVELPTRDCAAMIENLAFALTVELQMLAFEDAAAAQTEAPNFPSGGGPRASDGTAVNPDSPPAKPAEQARTDDAQPAEESPPAIRAEPVMTGALDPKRVAVALGGGVSAAVGLTPSAALGARLFASGRRQQVALELDFEGTLPSTTTAAGGPNFSHYVLATTAGACFEPAPFSACALGQAARLSIRGVGVDAPMTSSGWSFAMGLRAAAAMELGNRMFVRGRAEALAALTDWTVTLNREAVWTRPRVAASLGIDLGIHFR